MLIPLITDMIIDYSTCAARKLMEDEGWVPVPGILASAW